jgi:O-antigen biosynthesis protein
MRKLNGEHSKISYEKANVRGKFLYQGDQKLYIRGVTYGTFKPQENGLLFPEETMVRKDFTLMAQYGINAVRTYTVPPAYLLNVAQSLGIFVMVGLPWQQHVTFLDSRRTKKEIIQKVREAVTECMRHPAILCYAIGNEIPAPIVRWYGKRKVEHFLKQLYTSVKEIDPGTLVTYVNYPTTEYLNLDFLDFDCFNVYLETPEKLSAYISRLHNLSGDKPLLLAEIGMDSQRNGKAMQAETLHWQIETIFNKGCAGMFVFAWTDEWWRGGFDIEDWDFGVVDRQRIPKPALFSVSNALKAIPYYGKGSLPFFSVIVCSYNGSGTIRDCLEGLMKLEYFNFEVIVVNDGSRDNLAEIVEPYPVKLINTENRGLSSARNIGLLHANGEILAYIDDDAYPDPHWLNYLAFAYQTSSVAGIGGPNIAPFTDGPIATCVANAPGGPMHVLLTDEIAEHIPGCNMSFRKSALLKIGGFDPVFTAAGDDVDICWRVQESGGTIGFHPSALVWHHRRNSVKAYWRQQKGYGKAEALLENKWPEKYNAYGHLAWKGRIYGNGITLPLKLKRNKIFHGVWGSAAFQSVYQPANGLLTSLTLMPEWYIFSAILALLAIANTFSQSIFSLWPVFLGSVAIVLLQAVLSAYRNANLPRHEKNNYKYYTLITFLHVIQPMARLYGRFAYGLTAWRKRGAGVNRKFLLMLRVRVFLFWSESWNSSENWLSLIEQNLIKLKCSIKRGGDFDRWDLEIRTGLFVKGRGLLTIEEHGASKQMLKLKCWTNYSLTFCFLLAFLGILDLFAIVNDLKAISFIVPAIFFMLIFVVIRQASAAINTLFYSLNNLTGAQPQNKSQDFLQKEKTATSANGNVLRTFEKNAPVLIRSYKVEAVNGQTLE